MANGNFLHLDIPSNFRRVANFRFDFNKLRTTLEKKQECLCPQTGCKNEHMWQTPDRSADHDTLHTHTLRLQHCSVRPDAWQPVSHSDWTLSGTSPSFAGEQSAWGWNCPAKVHCLWQWTSVHLCETDVTLKAFRFTPHELRTIFVQLQPVLWPCHLPLRREFTRIGKSKSFVPQTKWVPEGLEE